MKKFFIIFMILMNIIVASSIQAKVKIENRLPGGNLCPVSEINIIVNDVRELGNEDQLKDNLVKFMIKNNIYLLYFAIKVPETDTLTSNNAITYMDGYIDEKYNMKTSLTGKGSTNLWYEFIPMSKKFNEEYTKKHPPVYNIVRPQPYTNRNRGF